ncbi:unnamed protein product [Ectocarpus fasciculatus]
MYTFYYFVVGMLWGCTNPFIKRAQQSIRLAEAKDHAESRSSLSFVKKIALNPILMAPFAINQCGSFVFYCLLANGNVSITSPACNALAVVFTALTGWYLGEKYTSPLKMAAGVVLVYVGVVLCALDSTS